MKIKSTKTTIEYAGRMLIQPGGFFGEEAVSDTLETTAQTVDLVNSPFKRLEEYQNVSVSRSFTIIRDYDSVEAAFVDKLEAETHAGRNSKGELTISVGSTTKKYDACLKQLDSNVSLHVNGIRLTLSYSFITGKEL